MKWRQGTHLFVFLQQARRLFDGTLLGSHARRFGYVRQYNGEGAGQPVDLQPENPVVMMQPITA